MTSYVTFATNAGYEDGPADFAIVYDDEGFEYVWPKDADPEFNDQDRLDLLFPNGEPDDLTADDYLNAALFNIGNFHATKAVEFDSRPKAVKHARAELKTDEAERDRLNSEELSGATGLRRAADGWIDSDEDVEKNLDEEEMMMFLYDALSPIDPDGPNGWLLRIMKDEEPRPGDELGFPVFSPDQGVDEEQ